MSTLSLFRIVGRARPRRARHCRNGAPAAAKLAFFSAISAISLSCGPRTGIARGSAYPDPTRRLRPSVERVGTYAAAVTSRGAIGPRDGAGLASRSEGTESRIGWGDRRSGFTGRDVLQAASDPADRVRERLRPGRRSGTYHKLVVGLSS